MTFNGVDNKLDTTKSLTIFSERQKDSLEANINTNGSSTSYGNIINDAVQEAQVSLQKFAASSDFTGSMNTAFGTSWDAKAVSKLQQSWLMGNFDDLPQIKISGDLDVIAANGAYASKTDTIYLSQGFIERNAHNIGEIKSVLLEEIGHSVDFRINQKDAAGDEGDIFSAVVLNKTLSNEKLFALKVEDDTTSVVIEGKFTQLELSAALRNKTEMLLGNRVDFNGDGRTDFLRQEKGHFADDSFGMFETYLSNGNGSFRKAWVSQDASRGFHGDMTNLFMGDFNGDGRTDFLRQEKGAFASDEWWMFETFISNGDGSFTSRFVMHDNAMHGDLSNLFIGDFNGDGKSDFIRQEKGHFANDTGRMFETYLSNGDGSFRKAWVSEDASKGFHGDMTNLFMGDFNGDGRTDFLRQEKGAFASDQWWMFETFISNGDGSFTSRFVMHDGAMNGDLTNLFIGDFNGDGKSDFIRQEKGHFANDAGRMFETYLSNGDGSFKRAWVSEDASKGFHGDMTNLFMGDFNGDGRTDFLRQEKGALASDQWWMFETFISNGNGSFTSRFAMHEIPMNGDLTKLFVGDFDGNGRSDFLRQERGSFASDNLGMLETYTSNSNGSFTKRWRVDQHAMHGDFTNLFTNNSTRPQVTIAPPVPSGYFRDELSSLTDNDWDIESGDDTRFDGNFSNGESRDSIKQIYRDLSAAILGNPRAMNAGYLYDASYRRVIGKSHSGIDMRAIAGEGVQAATNGRVLWTDSTNASTNGHFIAVQDTNGRVWVYGHLQSLGAWKKDNVVKVGDRIGVVGNQLGRNAHFHLAVGTKANGGSVAGGTEINVRNATVSPLQAYWEWKNKNNQQATNSHSSVLIENVAKSAPPQTPQTGGSSFDYGGKAYQWTRYTIKPGDNLSAIAQRTLGDGSANGFNFIAQRNKISNPSRINAGQVIDVPQLFNVYNPPVPTPSQTPQTGGSSFDYGGKAYQWTSYTIQASDTLSGIAQRTLGNANSSSLIAQRNNISNPNRINAGQVIEVPQSLNGYSPFRRPQPTPTSIPNPNFPVVDNRNWKAELFNNVNRAGTPTIVQDWGSGSQNFSRDWGNGSPGAGINSDNFSVRATTQRYFAPGRHEIQTISDDGVRVNINNRTVIDRLVDQAFTAHTGIFDAGGGGWFNVAIDYYERGGGARLDFKAASGDTYRGSITGKNYHGQTENQLIGINRVDNNYSEVVSSNTKTWLIIHGMNGKPYSGDMSDDVQLLASAIDGYEPGDQVFALDWSQAAFSNSMLFGAPNPNFGATWIETVAGWATDKLTSWGISGSNINLAGHSLGAYVAAEIAERIVGGVNRLLAFDPASSNLGLGGYDANSVNFSAHSQWSWAFYTSYLGNSGRAMTADDTFTMWTNWPNKPIDDHGNGMDLFASMLTRNDSISNLFKLDRMGQRPWMTNQFNENGKRFSPYDGNYEGEIRAKLENGRWVPSSLMYRSADAQWWDSDIVLWA
ncbi:MAG: VCBS repeat-containing protein [Rivularia sp. T60_A2020_040]|nr:VCBS repeat-containing protein [Rivularia sp. T60_A2020_040]